MASNVDISNQNTDFRVAVVGHSYVKHLNNFAADLPNKEQFLSVSPASPRSNLLDLNNCFVEWYSKPGSTVASLSADRHIRHKLGFLDPHLIFLQIGSNDLDNELHEPLDVAYAISEFADKLISEFSLNKVLVGKLAQRKKTRNITVEEYNEKVHKTNRYIENYCEPLSSFSSATFWNHKGIANPGKNIYFRDGVHMNDLGNLKLYRSIRSGVLASMKLFYYF